MRRHITNGIVAVVAVILTPWLGFVLYNTFALNLPLSYGTALLLPPVQIWWTAMAIVGKILYQWPARLAALSLVLITALAVNWRAIRKRFHSL